MRYHGGYTPDHARSCQKLSLVSALYRQIEVRENCFGILQKREQGGIRHRISTASTWFIPHWMNPVDHFAQEGDDHQTADDKMQPQRAPSPDWQHLGLYSQKRSICRNANDGCCRSGRKQAQKAIPKTYQSGLINVSGDKTSIALTNTKAAIISNLRCYSS